MKVLCLIAIASIMCGCSNEKGTTINYQYAYPDYTVESVHTTDYTNGCKEIVITLKQVEK